jgi:hypothetical protein
LHVYEVRPRKDHRGVAWQNTRIMLVFAFSLIALQSVVDLQAAEPRFRPALIGNGPKALINLINTKRLMEKGQHDGLLMFSCRVNSTGKVQYYFIYRETPGAKLLKEEVGYALPDCRFIPAIYDGERADVWFEGTVVLFVIDGQPHLRIYANQNHDDIAKGNDFIAPQVLLSSLAREVGGFDSIMAKARVYGQKGAIELSVTVDAMGNQKGMKVILEDPPGFGLGQGALKTYAKAKWIPGFRNGHPVECTFDYSEWFITSREWHGWR